MTREFAHGLSVTKPTTSRATVLLTPIMEIRRAPWVLSSLRSFARSGKKLNGMKNPETEHNSCQGENKYTNAINLEVRNK